MGSEIISDVELTSTPPASHSSAQYDSHFPPTERLPDRIEMHFSNVLGTVEVTTCGRRIGDTLTDQSYHPDGYRFHDAFHLANAAVLGWSPILRALLRRRRRSRPDLDMVEDGGRAQMIEEALCHIVFVHGRDGGNVINVERVDRTFLEYLRRLVLGLEVDSRPPEDWAAAIVAGWAGFEALRNGQCARLVADLGRRTLEFH